EIRAGKGTGGAGHQADPPRHASAVFGGREDPHRVIRATRRGQYRRAVPARRDRAEPLLPLVERVSRGRQKAPCWWHGPLGDLGRGQGPAAGSQRLEGGGCRADAGKPLAEKNVWPAPSARGTCEVI